MSEKSYEELWNEVDVSKTEDLTTPEPNTALPEDSQEDLTTPELNETLPEDNQEDLTTPEPNETLPEVKEDKKSLTTDDLEKIFNERDEKKAQERLEKEEAERKTSEENSRKETERLEKEKFENDSIFKDFQFDSSKVLSEEDKKIVTEVEKEVPEIAKYLTIIKKQMQAEFDEKVKFLEKSTKKGLTESYSNMYDKINKEYLPILQPLANQAHEQKVSFIKQEIAKKHPDYEEITPEVDKWILSQDEEMKNAISQMLGSGDVNKIVKVFDFYKKDNGLIEVNKPEQKTNDPIKDKKKQSLQGVSSKNNNSQVSSNDTQSYEDMWKSVKV